MCCCCCWSTILLLLGLGFVQPVITSQDSNNSLSISSSDIVQSVTNFASLNNILATNKTNIPNVSVSTSSHVGNTTGKTHPIKVLSSKHVLSNTSTKLVTKSTILLTASGAVSSSRGVASETQKYKNNTSVNSVISSSKTSTSVKSPSSSPTMVAITPAKSSTFINMTRTVTNHHGHSNVVKTPSVIIKESQNKTSIGLAMKSTPSLVATHKTDNLNKSINSKGTSSVSIKQTSTTENKNTGVIQVTTSLPVTTNASKEIKSSFSRASVSNVSLKSKSRISPTTSIPIVKIKNTAEEGMKPSTILKSTLPISSSHITGSSTSSISTRGGNVILSTTPKVSLSSSNSEKRITSIISKISSSSMSSKASLVPTKNASATNVNASQASSTPKVIAITSTLKHVISSTSAVHTVATTSLVVVPVKSSSSTSSSSFKKSKHVIISAVSSTPYIKESVHSSSYKKSKHVTSSVISPTPYIKESFPSSSQKKSRHVITSTFSPTPYIKKSVQSSTLSTKPKLAITTAISPTSYIKESVQTKVDATDFNNGSDKVPLTMGGRIGIGVAIAAAIIIIVLLIYFAKSKHKINRYRRYDNTYQIPGFTDIGGMVQLSTIGDSEYEILDATDYTRGDNPLYDLAQNPGQQQQQPPYDNHAYARNDHHANEEILNTNNANFTNFSTFKE